MTLTSCTLISTRPPPTLPLISRPTKNVSNFLKNPRILTLRCSSLMPEPEGRGQKQSTVKFERLFSNLNQATMKREPGSVTSGILLVAGTTVGAGILAIPAVTQEVGFLASAVTCILCWIYMDC